MKLKEIGEFGFIDQIRSKFADIGTKGIFGIGDDCAIIDANEREDWLVSTDLLIEDIHFIKNAITPEQLGYKSLAVNISDIAAMGGTPIGSFLSIAIPADIDVAYLDSFLDGYHKLSEKYNVPLLGGDTTKSAKHLAINVAILGSVPKGKARKRSMAKAGDAICVTGTLGDSAGGLHVVLDKIDISDEARFLLNKHYCPEPRIIEGFSLRENPSVHAMMDISDGIASDLMHILRASKKSAQIEIDKLPISSQLRYESARNNWNPSQFAIGGGEDYELLFTVDSQQIADLQHQFQSKFNCGITVIGSIAEGEPQIKWMLNKQEISYKAGGFDHFVKE